MDDHQPLLNEIADVLARLPVRAETGSELDALRRREAAREILRIPAIADALKLKVVKPLNLGHSISTGTRR